MMRKHSIYVQAMACLFLLTCPLFAAEYYVSPTGSDSGSGTLASPYKTIGKAVSVATAGDTIYLRGGQHDYTARISISKSGSSGNPITLRSYPGEVPILDFTGQSIGSSSQGISLSGSYWVFYNFTIQNAGDNGLYITGTNNRIELIVARWNEDSGIQLHTGAANNLILHCDSYENYDSLNLGENADGFATKFGLGTGNILRGCRSWNNSDDGYDCWNTDPPSESVTFDRCWAFRNGIDRWGAGSGFNGDGNGFKLGAGAGAHVLINCLAYDNPHNGIDVNGNTSGVLVYNCTCLLNSGRNFYFDEHNSAHVLRNNMSHLGSVLMYDEIDDQYNSWNGFTITNADFASLDSTGIDGPRQADGSLPELSFARLSAASAAIDAGVDVGLPYEGAAPDLGAYEYVEGDYPPAAPTGLSAAAGYETVTLDWDDNSESDLDGYNIYRSTSPGGPYTTPLNGALLISSDYSDMDVIPNTIYYYVVTAVDVNANESAASGEVSAVPILYGDFIVNGIVNKEDLDYLCALWLEDDCQLTAQIDLGSDCIVNLYEFSAFARNWNIADVIPPAAPTGLAATAGDGTVTLDWNDNGEIDLDGYNIYRSTASGSGYTRLNSTLLATSDYTDSTVSNGTTYYYVVTAVDTSANESGYSNEEPAAPNPPITTLTIQENEIGFCGVDGSIDNNNAGFTGDGFANTTNGIGYGVDYSVNILTAGTYTFTWRYANGSSARPGNLKINGTTQVSGINFPATGGWTTWTTTAAVEVTLTAGVKEIRLEATTSGGLANIDYMQVEGPNLEAASCP
jgi:fibronectin type 3 domain-containing protein